MWPYSWTVIIGTSSWRLTWLLCTLWCGDPPGVLEVKNPSELEIARLSCNDKLDKIPLPLPSMFLFVTVARLPLPLPSISLFFSLVCPLFCEWEALALLDWLNKTLAPSVVDSSEDPWPLPLYTLPSSECSFPGSRMTYSTGDKRPSPKSTSALKLDRVDLPFRTAIVPPACRFALFVPVKNTMISIGCVKTLN